MTNESPNTQETDSRYQVIATLGRGGMAEVYLTRMTGPSGFAKLAVLKRLREDREHDDDQGFRRMFLDEARLAARLNHSNIVQTFETGEDERGVFLAMEYLEGQPLSLWLKRLRKRGERLPMEVSLYILISVLEALEYAHGLLDFDGTPLRIVHRDVSPQNIFITYQGGVKLVDFGVAKATNSSEHTQIGVIKGKISYMSREQAQGAPDLDGRADVFSAAIILWEALTGKRIWGKLSDVEILTGLIQGAPLDRPSQTVPEVPEELDEVLMKALSLDRAERYQSAQQFLEALEHTRNDFGLYTSAREVGVLVAKEFASEREKVRDALLVLGKGGQPDSNPFGSPSGFFREGESRSGASARSRRSSAPPRSTSGMRRVEGSDEEAQDQVEEPEPIAAEEATAGNAKWYVGAALGALALLGVYFAVRGHSKPADTGVQAQGAPPSAIVAPMISRTQAAEAELEVTVTPLSARLYLDDQLLAGNPFRGRVPKDRGSHTLRAEAPGFKTREIPLDLDRDHSVDFTLQPVPGALLPWPPTHPSATAAPSAHATVTAAEPTSRGFEELVPNGKSDKPDDKKLQLDTDAFKRK